MTRSLQNLCSIDEWGIFLQAKTWMISTACMLIKQRRDISLKLQGSIWGLFLNTACSKPFNFPFFFARALDEGSHLCALENWGANTSFYGKLVTFERLPTSWDQVPSSGHIEWGGHVTRICDFPCGGQTFSLNPQINTIQATHASQTTNKPKNKILWKSWVYLIIKSLDNNSEQRCKWSLPSILRRWGSRVFQVGLSLSPSYWILSLSKDWIMQNPAQTIATSLISIQWDWNDSMRGV